ncbi:MAG: HEPN domain-containing protein [Candidatus Poribacteria bacterium]|nr:HEPN domain-containing protein [Candidatus Poribacteria bacterium]
MEGIKIKTETPIFEGIRLVCLPNSTSELPPYARNLYIHPFDISTGSFLGKALLIIDYSVFPIFHKPFDSTTIQEYRKLLNRTFRVEINGDKSVDSYLADFSGELFCQALSLACNSAVQAARKWRFLADDEIFNLNYGTGGSVRITGLFGNSVEAGQMETLEKLKIPIGRWIKSHTSQISDDRMIDLGIAFESLYLSGIESKNEIRFRFSLHAAWYLGEDKEHREGLMKKFKTIYDWRSKVVHTGKLPNKTKNTPFTRQEINVFIKEAQDLCRDSIMKILEDGKFPDWNDLILG